MSELFMECEEEELEPWQKAIPEINLVDDDDDDDDDEPIFVGEIQSSKPANARPNVGVPRGQQNVPAGRRNVGSAQMPSQKPPQVSPPMPTVKRASYAPSPQNTTRVAPPPSSNNPTLIPASSNQVTGLNVGRVGNTVTPQPIIINNQGYIVSSPQIANSGPFITSIGSQYPPGTSFAVLPAGQPLLQQVSQSNSLHPMVGGGVVHRPQVQLIQNNVVTLANVQAPPDLQGPHPHPTASALGPPPHRSMGAPQPQPQPQHQVMSRQDSAASALASLQGLNNRDNGTVKRSFPSDMDKTKRLKVDAAGNLRMSEFAENESPSRRRCPRCMGSYPGDDSLRGHMRYCCPDLLETVFGTSSRQDKSAAPLRVYDMDKGKLIMLVTDFYYGRCEGDQHLEQKTHTTFKCNSCLKVLKNNIRFMNHMKHHLELEKQNSESWESHTTCQHCYRQYSTPFQLQCHIESAHSPYESTTNCKICELAFETEQVLLEHMKDNHKPGEMPYACQVCNYRSSFFSDVESHFRTIHENTKDLLCPFCLKVLRSGHMFMQHYMRHQKKGIHRCGKCRLNFLTYKEKVEHKTHFHRTYRKPRTLEGLPPGTKVTIRASLSGGSPSSSSALCRSSISVVPGIPAARPVGRPPNSAGRGKASPQNSVGPVKTKKERNKPVDLRNFNLRHFRAPEGKSVCMECSAAVKDFYDHFPLLLTCAACKYKTCCRRSYRNHMSRFHSAGSKERRKNMRTQGALRSLTLVCLNCDFLADATGSDLMSKHLIDRPTHACQVIMEQPQENHDSVSDKASLERSDLADDKPAKLDDELLGNTTKQEEDACKEEDTPSDPAPPTPVTIDSASEERSQDTPLENETPPDQEKDTSSEHISETPAGVPSEDISPADMPSEDISPADMPSEDISPAGVPSEDISPAGVPSEDISPAGVPSEDISPAGVPSEDISPAGVPSENVTPSDRDSPSEVPIEHEAAMELDDPVEPEKVAEPEITGERETATEPEVETGVEPSTEKPSTEPPSAEQPSTGRPEDAADEVPLEPLTPSKVLEHEATEMLPVSANQSADTDCVDTPSSPNGPSESVTV
ncbi:zinc finger protein 280D [Sardina pilchardus]|uniref:zinc finger protein 280D n=1 Tax=Sardina pilchardus TaxID=27697 RepID=UPI002E12BE21